MASTKPTETNGASDSKPDNPSSASEEVIAIPKWINKENFAGVLETNFKGFKKILKFEAAKTGGAGENYASAMVRVKTKFELEDGSTKDAAFMIKTVIEEVGEGSQMIGAMGCFPKESAMYGKYLREFEQMYADVGKQVTIGPKFYTFNKDPGCPYVLLEDLSPAGFKNADRLVGLDKEHTESVLKMMAELHAASAVRHAIKGEYEESFKKFMFDDGNRDMLGAMMTPLLTLMKESFSKFKGIAKYLHFLLPDIEDMIDLAIDMGKYHPNDFNVIIHGDLWVNNVMFRYNDEGKREQTMFVDFQMSRHTSPTVDLFYFLMSSPNLDLKLNSFDDFVKFYHDHLIENLKLLKYPGKLITLKQLHIDLLKNNAWALNTITGVLAAVLLDPSENASIDNFFGDGEQAVNFQRQLYENPRYVNQLEAILPWLNKRGYLDVYSSK